MPSSLDDAGFRFVTFSRMGKIKRFLMHWKHGREEKYPICCILRLSIETALRDGKTFYISEIKENHRGLGNKGQVPCDVFHHRVWEKNDHYSTIH